MKSLTLDVKASASDLIAEARGVKVSVGGKGLIAGGKGLLAGNKDLIASRRDLIASSIRLAAIVVFLFVMLPVSGQNMSAVMQGTFTDEPSAPITEQNASTIGQMTPITMQDALATSKDVYTPILKTIEQNSLTLDALKKQAEARKTGNRTGLTPANPEVEFGYLWGNPVAIGNRKDISVRQTFDFPTVYAQRSKLADAQDDNAEYEYRAQRADLLLAAKRTCIELVYYNALSALYAEQTENARQIMNAVEKMRQAGEANILEYNKAVLNHTNISGELNRTNLERRRLLAELTRMNGGQPIVFDCASYGSHALPADFDSWYAEAEANAPALHYLKAQAEASNRQVSLTKASTLPKFSVGYMGEFVTGEKFQGITVGMSIPLWENKNKVRQAEAEARTAVQLAEDARMQYYNRLKSLYAEIAGLQENVRQYDAVLQQNDNARLLLKAYQSGEISLLEYLLEMEYHFTALDKRLQAERDLELALAELNAYQL
ncbi:MAG: TolC family protein [Prevotella sp.]|nr:TolC family protein [Prevotella sp.]